MLLNWGCGLYTDVYGSLECVILSGNIARSIVNNDAMNKEEFKVEDEESDEEYRDDVVQKEIGKETTNTRKLKRSR